MTEATKPEGAVEETPASEPAGTLDPARASIYEKYAQIKAAREAAEATPAEDTPEETPRKSASEPEGETEAVPAIVPPAPEPETLTPEEFTERFKNVKVKGKFAGEEAVVDAKDLLRVQGLDRHLTKRLQEVARKEESLGAVQPPPTEYRPADAPPAADKALRYWAEPEVAAKYDEIFQESPYKANQFLNTVQAERQRAQAENEKVRMDTAEKDFLALHTEMEPTDYDAMKSSFSDPEFFRKNPDVDHAFQRRDYYGALELARIKLVEKKLNEKFGAIKAAQEAALAEEQKRIDLKKKGAVLRTTSKQEAKPKEEFKPPTAEDYIRQMQAKRRASMNIK
jgi:hypothetical protein